MKSWQQITLIRWNAILWAGNLSQNVFITWLETLCSKKVQWCFFFWNKSKKSNGICNSGPILFAGPILFYPFSRPDPSWTSQEDPRIGRIAYGQMPKDKVKWHNRETPLIRNSCVCLSESWTRLVQRRRIWYFLQVKGHVFYGFSSPGILVI